MSFEFQLPEGISNMMNGGLPSPDTVSGGTDVTLNFNYDGSTNSTANIGFYSCSAQNGNTNNYLFHRFKTLNISC